MCHRIKNCRFFKEYKSSTSQAVQKLLAIYCKQSGNSLFCPQSLILAANLPRDPLQAEIQNEI